MTTTSDQRTVWGFYGVMFLIWTGFGAFFGLGILSPLYGAATVILGHSLGKFLKYLHRKDKK